MFTYELARRLENTGVTVNALHPGLVATNLPGNTNMRLRWLVGPVLRSILAIAGKSTTHGCKTVVYLATAPDIENVTGKYYVDELEVPSSGMSYDTALAGRLWELSRQLTGLSPEIA